MYKIFVSFIYVRTSHWFETFIVFVDYERDRATDAVILSVKRDIVVLRNVYSSLQAGNYWRYVK